ncbi:MAG: DUF4105 domain-containing protein, partial [Proteobacteria bacterium]|nr:DUF4105 domain-containing protein [Pseudomonadota bacterium]
MRFLLVVLLLLSLPEPLKAVSNFQQLERKGLARYWIKLLHYEKNLTGDYLSLVTSPYFFNHPEGRSDPEKELDATLDLLKKPEAKAGFGAKHPQCVFVERYRFLKEAGLIATKDLPCPDFVEWKRGIGAKSVVLIFSSAYPNNPASAFGHTFIRFKGENSNPLLDYSASYAAMTRGDSLGVLYAIKGLIGSYKGVFSVTPYYMKVNEYNDSESRDLFEYELEISHKAVGRIVNHLWELYSSAYFDYYFLDENCSYIMSKVLELGNPDWELSDSGRWFYLPSDSIKALTKSEGAIRSFKYRPSLKKRALVIFNQLNAEEVRVFHEVTEGKIPVISVKNVKVLDALIALWNFKKRQQKKAFSVDDKAVLRKLLLHRATLGFSPGEIMPIEYEHLRPENSHAASRFMLGKQDVNGESIYQLRYKSGLHDLLSSDMGFEPNTQIDFLGMGIKYEPAKEKVQIDHLLFVNIRSLQPYSRFDPRFSWGVSATYEQIFDLPCKDCYKFDFNLGFGGSAFVAGQDFVVYLIAGP